MSAVTRRQLLNAGRRVFARLGFDGARVDLIAREAGVNKALINYHFRGKEGLYREVLAEELRGATEALESRLAAEHSAERRLLAWPAALAALLEERPTLAPLLLGEGLRDGPGLDPDALPGEALLARTLGEARGDGRLPPLETADLQPVLLGTVLLAGLQGSAAPAATLLAGLLERGLLTPPTDTGDR